MKSLQKIRIILALVFFLPALFYSIYEIMSMKKDEEMVQQIQEIYNRQLEVILFSVNQYADDVVNSWTSKIEIDIAKIDGKTDIKNLLTYNSAIAAIFRVDTIGKIPVSQVFSLNDSQNNHYQKRIDSAVYSNKKKIENIISYKQSGFRKIELLPTQQLEREKLRCLTFLTQDQSQRLRLVGVLVNPEIFIQEVVGPRLQIIAKDKFVLSVHHKGDAVPVYSTLETDTVKIKSETHSKGFWIFPEFELGIRTSDASLQKLIEERTYTNLILLVMLDVVLIMAVILVFRNVKKEVQLAQNKSDFVSNVSHEIRTPLALISMFAETLEMGRVKSEEKKLEYYSIIHKETQRLSGIVNKILNFSQTEANKKNLTITSLDVGEQVNEILTTYEFHLKSKGFEYTFQEIEKLWVQADKEAFTEVLINLIDNAVKYSSEKKYIEIKSGRENGFGFVTVKDHGIGISKMDQKHIFDKFHRVSSGNLAKTSGTGLGLSLVKQLMEIQKGRVTVFSEPGKGSEFTLYFPLDIKYP